MRKQVLFAWSNLFPVGEQAIPKSMLSRTSDRLKATANVAVALRRREGVGKLVEILEAFALIPVETGLPSILLELSEKVSFLKLPFSGEGRKIDCGRLEILDSP